MARPLRIEYPGACFHVINRGNYQRNLFTAKGAAEAFISVLGEAAERYGWKIHAYVVMSNHFHLAVELTEPNLSLGMKWLQGTWVRRTNVFRRVSGRPFQGRYKALIVESGEGFARVCHYIHLNPFRAGLVAAGKGGSYAWSSLARFKAGARPAWLIPNTVLAACGGLADSPAGWASYEHMLGVMVVRDKDERALHSSKLSRGWCVGGAEFKERMVRAAAQAGMDLRAKRFEGVEPECWLEELAASWETALCGYAKAAGIDLQNLGPRKSESSKAMLAALMKLSTSVSNAWLAERLQMGEPASASQFARRFRLNSENEAKLQAVLRKCR